MIADKPRPSTQQIEALRNRLIEKRQSLLRGEKIESEFEGVSQSFKFQRKQPPPQNESHILM